MSDAAHSIRSFYKLLSTYLDRCIQNTVEHLRWSVLQKELCMTAVGQPEIFHGKGGRRLDFTKNTRKRGLGGHSFFNGKFSPKMDTIRAFLSKIKKLFLICIKDRGG